MRSVAASLEMRSVFFRGLGEPSRLALVEQLARGDRRVSDLASATGLSQPNVSKHLACLWDCGLVERERRGREIHYRLVRGLTELLDSADDVLERTGDRVMACPRFGRAAQRRAA
jgi:ArsR family transcriptional regulator, cadmium/lead-responsive transcriptional repressor